MLIEILPCHILIALILLIDLLKRGLQPEVSKSRGAKRIPIRLARLFTSGYTQNAVVHGGRLDDGVELISKPYRRQQLARRLRRLLARPTGEEPPSFPA